MVDSREWQEFKDNGMLWFINMILHTFGWALVFNVDKRGNITKVFPARVKFRGFDEKSNSDGYIKVSKYLQNNIDDILKESME